MTLLVEKLATPLTPSSWAEVQKFSEKEIIVVASVNKSSEVGPEVITRLKEDYDHSLENSPYHALKLAVKKVGEEFSNFGIIIIAFAYISGDVYLVLWGEGQVRIKRDGKLGLLILGERESLKFLSGRAREGDRFMVATNSFFQVVSESEADKALLLSLPDAAAFLSPKIFGKEQTIPIACALVEIPLFPSRPKTGFKVGLPVEKILETTKLLSGRISWGLAHLFKKLRRREIYTQEVHPKRSTLILGVGFLALIMVAAFWGLTKKGEEARVGSYENIIFEAQNNLSQSQELNDLNPVRARDLGKKVKVALAQLEARAVKDSRFIKLKEEAERILPAILREYRVLPRPVLDLGLVREGFKTSEVASSGNRVLVLDDQKRIILSFTVEGQEMRVVSGPDNIPEASHIAFWEDRVFVLDGQRIAQIEKEGQARTVILPEGKWGKIIQMAAYGGNLYLLDSGKNQIWRYPASPSGGPLISDGRFGAPQEWLAKDIRVDFSDAVAMAIDGSVWLLKQDGRIEKYTRGAPDSFRIEDLEKGFSLPLALATGNELANLYILDPGNARIVVLDKSGQYQAQYLWDPPAGGLREATSLAVSEGQKKILVFVEGKVYEIELK